LAGIGREAGIVELIANILALVFWVCLIWLAYAVIKKKNLKKPVIAALISLVLAIGTMAITQPSGKNRISNESLNSLSREPDCSIGKVKDTLTLYYLNNKIYQPVDCETEKINGNWFVFCHPPMVKIGGLYLIRFDKNCNYTLYAVNGKAKQHAKRGLTVKDINIPELKKLTGLDDISKILEEF
jgi:hypothetical protein